MAAHDPSLPDTAREALDRWLGAHDRAVPGLLADVHIVGSLALDDWRPRRDIDVVAVMSREPVAEEIAALRSLGVDSAPTIDGPYLHPGDLASTPRPLVRPWRLDGEFHHDDGCFELNPVVWATVARHALTVRGTPPTLGDVVDEPELLTAFVVENTRTYWAAVTDMVAEALADSDRQTFAGDTTEWCVLGSARMLCTVRTGDIVSKSAAGRWLAVERPESADLVGRALALRNADEPPTVDRATAEATLDHLRQIVHLTTDAV